MKVVSSANWQDSVPFDEPVLVSEVVPGDPARCATCGPDSDAVARTALWVVKHKHPRHHGGFVRFYCATHVPQVQRPEPAREPAKARAERRPAARRSPSAPPERPAAVCPNCFIEVPPTGQCGVCGYEVA